MPEAATSTTPPAETATPPAQQPGSTPPAADDWETSDGKGGKQQVLADLAEARKEAKEAKALRAKIAEYEQRDMTEAQKLEARASTAEAALTPLQQENARLRVAIDKKVPSELVDRLKGSTLEELSADADELMKLVKVGDTPPPNFDGGGRTTSKTTDMNQIIRDAGRRR